MTEPSPARPVPGPPRPGPLRPGPPRDGDQPTGRASGDSAPAGSSVGDVRPDTQPVPAGAVKDPEATSFGDLEQHPVTEHVAVFEAEHARLQRELGTIDSL